MELWVRSQRKKILLRVNEINAEVLGGYGIFYVIMANKQKVGEYETEERCLEILDEIQKLLIENSDPLVLLRNDIDDMDLQDGAIIGIPPKDKEKVFQKSALIYEMPEK